MFLSAGAAQGATVSTTGSSATGTTAGKLTVTDTKFENDLAYANWNGSGSNRVTTPGDGKSATVTVSPLNSFRACRDQGSFNPDNCSSYVNP